MVTERYSLTLTHYYFDHEDKSINNWGELSQVTYANVYPVEGKNEFEVLTEAVEGTMKRMIEEQGLPLKIERTLFAERELINKRKVIGELRRMVGKLMSYGDITLEEKNAVEIVIGALKGDKR